MKHCKKCAYYEICTRKPITSGTNDGSECDNFTRKYVWQIIDSIEEVIKEIVR